MKFSRNILRANTLFRKKVRQKKYGCRFQRYITFHVSFNIYSNILHGDTDADHDDNADALNYSRAKAKS